MPFFFFFAKRRRPVTPLPRLLQVHHTPSSVGPVIVIIIIYRTMDHISDGPFSFFEFISNLFFPHIQYIPTCHIDMLHVRFSFRLSIRLGYRELCIYCYRGVHRDESLSSNNSNRERLRHDQMMLLQKEIEKKNVKQIPKTQ